MKVKQVVDAKFHYFYCGYGSLSFEEADGSKINIDVTDDEILSMADKLAEKAEYIRSKREEKSNSGE